MRFRRDSILVVIIFAALCWTARVAGAQPLADRVPGGAIVYVGWAGADSPNTGYAGSHLEAVVNDANFKATFDQVVAQVMAKEGASPEDQKTFETAKSIAGPFWRHPAAFFIEPSPEGNDARGGVICQAGAEAKDLVSKLKESLAKDRHAAETFQVVEAGDLVAIVFNYGKAAPSFPAVGAADALLKAPAFVAAMKQTVQNPVVSVYRDIEGGIKLINLQHIDPEAQRVWPIILESSGLNGLHRIAIGARFEGKDFATATFVEAPAPRKGLVKLFEGRPVEPEIFKSIPRTAGSAQMARFDIAAFVNELRRIVGQADERGGQVFDQALGAVQMSIGRNPMTDILEPLGDTWLIYSDDSIAGNSTQGLIVTNKLDDAAKAKQGLASVWIAAMNMANPQFQRRGAPVQFQQSKVGELTVYSVATPTITPGFTIDKDRLVIAFSPDTISKAAAATAPGGAPGGAPGAAGAAPAPGFDQNEKFIALQKRLVPAGAAICGFRFADLPQTAPAMYQEYTQAIAMLSGLAQQEGIQLPEKILPSLEVIQAHLSPAADVSWTDDAGFHTRSITPFPGADALSNAPNGTVTQVGGGALAVSILLPSLNRARETANRVKCASNMRQIGQAMLLYSNDHKGAYPPDLATILREEDVTIDVFICPSSDNSPPNGVENMTPDQLAGWVQKNANYIYLGAGKNNMSPVEDILLYEKPDDHSHDGINVMFGDGHVEFLIMREAKQRIPELEGQ